MWCVVEFATTHACWVEFKRADKLVVIYGLLFDEARGYHDDEDTSRVAHQRPEHDARECIIACVCKGNIACGGRYCGDAVGGFSTASVCPHTHFGVRGAVYTYHEHTRWKFGKAGAEPIVKNVCVVLNVSVWVVVDGNDPTRGPR